MIKTDDPFIQNNIVWKLGMTYNRQREATLNVNLNVVVNPFQDKKARVYFKKNEFFLPSNLANLNQDSHAQVVQILPTDFDDREEQEQEDLLKIKEKIENTMKIYPQHSFISFLASVKINQERY